MATITSAQSGLWSATSTWTGGVVPVVGDKVTIQNGHTVTVDGTYTAGDDTSSTTAANNALCVNGGGTLKFSRTVNSQLTVRGTLQILSNGTFDMGKTGDIIPSGVTATLIVNDSAALVAGKHLLGSHGASDPKWFIRGIRRTRNASLTAATAAGATQIQLDDTTGWANGDQIVVASDTDDATRAQVVTLGSNVSGTTWNCGAITNARAIGCKVGNLSGNVVIKSASNTAPGNIEFYIGSTSTAARLDVGDFRAEDLGSASGWAQFTSPGTYGVGAVVNSSFSEKIERVAHVHTTGSGSIRFFGIGSPAGAQVLFSDCAGYEVPNNASYCFYSGDSSNVKWDNCVCYKAGVGAVSGYSAGASNGLMTNCEVWGVTAAIQMDSCISYSLDSCRLHGGANLCVGNYGRAKITNSYLGATKMFTHALWAVTGIDAVNCTYGGTLLTNGTMNGQQPNQITDSRHTAIAGAASDNRRISYYHTSITDTATRNRGSYSVKMQPKQAFNAITYTFTIAGVAGVPQRVKGFLRFDTNYGTSNPPSIALSGQGVSQSYTCTATANAWFGFDFSFTPTTTGDITATVTISSAVTTGFAWLDGVYHYPMIQKVRHFGFVYDNPATSLVADSRIAVSEATALGYAVSVNHGTSTITVSAALTNAQVFQALMADLCQSTNLDRAVHVSSSDGANFTTTYTVAFSGSGAISGRYTDANGPVVPISITGIVAGSQLLIKRTDTSAVLVNQTVAGTSYTAQFQTTSNVPIAVTLRKATSAPYYQEWATTGSIDTVAGFTATANQQADQ